MKMNLSVLNVIVAYCNLHYIAHGQGQIQGHGKIVTAIPAISNTNSTQDSLTKLIWTIYERQSNITQEADIDWQQGIQPISMS